MHLGYILARLRVVRHQRARSKRHDPVAIYILLQTSRSAGAAGRTAGRAAGRAASRADTTPGARAPAAARAYPVTSRTRTAWHFVEVEWQRLCKPVDRVDVRVVVRERLHDGNAAGARGASDDGRGERAVVLHGWQVAA